MSKAFRSARTAHESNKLKERWERRQEAKQPAEGAETFLTVSNVLAAHAEHGRLDWHLVKKAMGPNWPPEWERLGPGEAIFLPEERRP